MRLMLISLAVALCVLLPVLALAGGQPITLTSIERLINSAVRIFFVIAGLAVVAGLVYAGFLMATAGSNSQRFEDGRTMLWQVIVGGAVVFGVGLIANTIAQFAQDPNSVVR